MLPDCELPAAEDDTVVDVELSHVGVLYSRKFSRTINFTVFEDFTPALKINSSKSYSIESYGSLVDSQNLIREMYCGEIASKTFFLKNYPLYGS